MLNRNEMEVRSDGNFKCGQSVGALRGGAAKFNRYSSQDFEENVLEKLNKPELVRNSAIYRTMSDDFCDSLQGYPGMRRGSSFIRMLSGDSDESRPFCRISRLDTRASSVDDDISRRSSKSDTRRESSFGRISEENDVDLEPLPVAAKLHSLLRVDAAAPAPQPEPVPVPADNTPDKNGAVPKEAHSANPTLVNVTPSYYLNLIENLNKLDCTNAFQSVNEEDENLLGEWDNFWRNYNCSNSDYLSNPNICPSNSLEESSHASDSSLQRGEHVFLTLAELSEAIDCTERLNEILRRASRRASFDSGDNRRKNSANDDGDKRKNLWKSANTSYLTLLLNNTGVADILKRVMARRRDFLLGTDLRRTN